MLTYVYFFCSGMQTKTAEFKPSMSKDAGAPMMNAKVKDFTPNFAMKSTPTVFQPSQAFTPSQPAMPAPGYMP